ncbi:MAG: aldehyde dehydrogenase family protein, partial [Chitinophagia bacterium]|nr:aldehyde dehydrogenase family protein [Chitinophagia bacterium]
MADTLLSVNPADGTVIAQHPITQPGEIDEILQRAADCYQRWKQTSLEHRAEVLRAIALILRQYQEELALLATAEMGKLLKQGREEVEKCAATLDYYAAQGSAMLSPEVIATDATKSYVTFQPMGAILAIMPWNFPYWQVLRAFAPIVFGGNVIVLKHASNVTGCALALQRIVEEAGAPVGLLQTLVLPSSAIEPIITHPVIAGVTLTGSTAAGRKVAEAAGRHLKKTVLELGGSDAYVIMEDADIEYAAEVCVNGRLKNSGQSCVAAKRFVVPESIAPAFEAAMAARMAAVTWGAPREEGNMVGPMARKDLRDDLHRQVVNSVAIGARILCGGYLPDGEGA